MLLILASITIFTYHANADVDTLKSPLCSFHHSINITDGHFDNETNSYSHEEKTYLPGQYDSFDYEISYGKRIPTETHIRGCSCQQKSCISLCCPRGKWYMEIMNGEYECTSIMKTSQWQMMVAVLDPETNSTEMLNILEIFEHVVRPKCLQYILNPSKNSTDEFKILSNGLLAAENDTIDIHEYCLSPAPDRTEGNVFICFDPDSEATDDPKLNIYPFAMMASVPFLVITLAVYAILPQLHNVHCKSLMCYLGGLAVGYSFLSVVQLKGYWDPPIMCHIMGYIVYAAFMTAFLWLNVISFDLWRNFCGSQRLLKVAESQKFREYCIYAFGIPALMVAFAVVMDSMGPEYVPYYLTPKIGKDTCFIKSGEVTLYAYFYLPIILILMSNSTFFTLTAITICRVQTEIRAMTAREDSRRHRKKLDKEKATYGVFLRLFLIMGITWITEILSAVFDNGSIVSYPTDFVNMLQGPCIFYFFVMKPNVRKLLMSRWNHLVGSKHISTESSESCSNFSSSANGNGRCNMSADV